MLKYETISEANKTDSRLRRGRYGGYYGDQHTRDGDRLALFTLTPQARKDSEQNFDFVMSMARRYNRQLVVIKPNQIQVAGELGADIDSVQQVADALFPGSWLKGYETWIDSSSPMHPRLDASHWGEVAEFYTYRPSMCLREHQGVYDVRTGRKLTNRRDIIQRMWDLGFAAVRGRPLSIAQIRWTGEREELQEISDLADRYWNRKYQSEAAKKLVSAFTSINRYAAWPGAW